jgi:ABC-type transporter Mla subunit MlaD
MLKQVQTQNQMSFGRKLGIAFGVMLAATVVLSVAALWSISGLSDEFDIAAVNITKKMQISDAMGTDTALLLSYERAALVRFSINEKERAATYDASFNEASKRIAAGIAEVRPLLATDEGKRLIKDLEDELNNWGSVHQEMWQTLRNGKFSAAMEIVDAKLLPIANKMQKTIDDFDALQSRLLAAAVEAGHGKVSTSHWTVGAASLFFLTVWGVALWIVRRASADQERLTKEREEAAASLEQLLTNITQKSGGLTRSSEELAGVSHQMAGVAEETATQANVVSAASEQVSKNVEIVATSAEELMASIREISKSSNEAARVAKAAVGVADQTNKRIGKLGESSIEIGKVIKVITSIAEQTNLLALNATIEAARAGEAGKGFAIVANEVKELAKQTALATEEIGEKIGAIQLDTTSAVQAIAEIAEIINQVNDISNTIASAVEEQNVTTTEIGRNVQEAAKGSGEIASNISGVATAAKTTAEGAQKLQRSSQAVNEMAGELEQLVMQSK